MSPSNPLDRLDRQTALLILVPLVLALGCQESPPSALPPPTVEVAQVERVPSARDLHLSGTLEAERSVVLSFPVPGTVEEVSVQEGQVVTRGQVLARVSSSSFRHSLGMAQAKAAQAEDAARRLEPMHQNGTVAEVKWVEVQTGLVEARHAVAIAPRNVENTVLRAPDSGVVSRRNVEPGANVLPGLSVMTLVRMETMLATVPVPENEVAKVRKGQPAVVTSQSIGRDLQGEVREIGVVADPLTRTYPVKIAIANPEGLLRVGMVVDARIGVDAGSTALAIPREAVRIDERGIPCVFVVSADGRLARRTVTLAGFAGERTALSGGVQEGDRVVISGTPMLADGVTVRVAPHGAEEG